MSLYPHPSHHYQQQHQHLQEPYQFIQNYTHTPLSPESTSSPVEDRSPTQSDEDNEDLLNHPSHNKHKGQTLMTSYMVPVKPGRMSTRGNKDHSKRVDVQPITATPASSTLSSTSTFSHSSSSHGSVHSNGQNPHSSTLASPISSDPFLVFGRGGQLPTTTPSPLLSGGYQATAYGLGLDGIGENLTNGSIGIGSGQGQDLTIVGQSQLGGTSGGLVNPYATPSLRPQSSSSSSITSASSVTRQQNANQFSYPPPLTSTLPLSHGTPVRYAQTPSVLATPSEAPSNTFQTPIIPSATPYQIQPQLQAVGPNGVYVGTTPSQLYPSFQQVPATQESSAITYQYQPVFATPQAQVQPQAYTMAMTRPGTVHGGSSVAYAIPYPPHHMVASSSASSSAAAGPSTSPAMFSDGYYLPPPPPPMMMHASTSYTHALEAQLPQQSYYYISPTQHGMHPQSAPAKMQPSTSGYYAHGYAYPPGYAVDGVTSVMGYETPSRPKRAPGSAKRSGGKTRAKVERAEGSDGRRSSLELTPPPVRAKLVGVVDKGNGGQDDTRARPELVREESSTGKKRQSPVKQGSSSETGQPQKEVKRSRGPEIKTSAAEGRRLVFPETPSPEADDIPLVLDGYVLPQTPPRQIRSLLPSPRNITAPGLIETPNGTARYGMKPMLESDLSWLEPVLKPSVMESPFYSPSASASKGVSSAGSLSRSERRRRRVEAFRVAEKEVVESSADLMTTVVKGYGRLAAKKGTALEFLGEDEKNVEPEKPLPLMSTPIMAPQTLGFPIAAGLLTPKSTPQSACTTTEDPAPAVLAVPDWPDTSYPWIDMTQSRKKDELKMAEVAKLEKLARIERYLNHVSDDELESSDDTEEHVDLSQPAVDLLESSDAKEAIFNVTRNGLPAFSAGPNGPYLSGVMPTATGEDESGCLCAGMQPDAGSMVCCDNCSIWFHLSCCGIATEEDLGESWFCWRCEPTTQAVVASLAGTMAPASDPVSTPELQNSQPAFSTEETTRTYHAYTSDAALAPSPVFSNSGRLPSHEDTPGLYFGTPRIPSSSSAYSRFMTPGTPFGTRRNISYAEHYNVCQTPGAPSSDYKKVYGTPKFEDLLNDYSTPHCMRDRTTSPTPGGMGSVSGRSRVLSLSNSLFTTPSTSQSFLQGLQGGSGTATPPLVPASSTSTHYSAYPASPPSLAAGGGGGGGGGASSLALKHPQLSELTASPSPLRTHRRQVSFNRVTFALNTGTASSSAGNGGGSNLKDQKQGEMQSLGKGRPKGLGTELAIVEESE